MAKQQNPKPVLPDFSPELKENISTYESSVSNEIIVPRSAVRSPAQAENLIEAFSFFCLFKEISAQIKLKGLYLGSDCVHLGTKIVSKFYPEPGFSYGPRFWENKIFKIKFYFK